ncbi:glycosyltransferase family 2 protein [Mucilaginibacter auburnensis]|uniref:GT2 family glycosyltransferase n=1 Tax=Mucilaginibacter auburnensis TaxID=1457233 RepID=A0A2H9VW57_9SPHI|nr:glycosyltransferase [Mucilaginibacter auburnensis]PJJ85041.1 GT2 family glycosyltransferase [Mucilaginibacter auburnensis]
MQISVVVPTYKRPALLKKCLDALRLQTIDATEYEVIVVSDGPDILTENMVNEMQDGYNQLRFIALSENKGPAAARNTGWLYAKGRIIAFTDDDCLPDKNWLKQIVTFIGEHTISAVSGRVIVPRAKRPTDYELNTSGLETAEFVTANCACTKAALIAVGGFDERFRMAWREDSDLHFKFLAQQVQLNYLDSAVVVHPVRQICWGVSLKEQKKTLFNALLYQKHPQLYRMRIQSMPPMLYYFIVAAFALMIIGLLLANVALIKSGLLFWASLTAYFIIKRLYKTSLAPAHVAEMVITSVFIPFLSIYWQWYGAIKYRILFF